MIKQEEKEDLLAEIENFISSDFSSMDLVNFILDNMLAQDLLRKVTYYEYDKELNYIESADPSDIESFLKMRPIEFYDPDYGSNDPVSSFRLSKADIEECETMDDLRECDNILSHLLDQLELEPIKVELEEILSKDNLEKLVKGKIDCSANQIYFFEKVTDYTEFNFHHYYRENNGSWSCNTYNCDVGDFDTIIDINHFNNCIEGFEAYIAYFYNLYRIKYSQNFSDIEFSSTLFLKYIISTLDNTVYNGVNAIKQLRDFVCISFPFLWHKKQQDIEEENKKIKGDLIAHLEKHKNTLNKLLITDLKTLERYIEEAKPNIMELVVENALSISDLVSAVEKRDKDIEDLKSNVHELEVHLRYEKSKNEVLELELKKKQNDSNQP